MNKGRLRVYLGASPGVGKTFAMLEEGQRRAERGTDVVIGYVENHGRPKTSRAAEGLEVVARRNIDYKGTRQEEMDLDAVLARRPAVVLVDELAHTNVPGSRHEKRWQDVQALREAGIEVITTVNIQHLESLNDVTESITGVRQRETVPDQVVRSADQIELVDMSPQALRRRMAHGNIYAADKVDAALTQYFREGNLTALRELALLWLADRVDEGLERYRDQHQIDATWATRERIVVPVSGGPESHTLMRRAVRIASRVAGGEWRALYVARTDGLTGVDPATLASLREKAEQLGGTFHTVVSDHTVEGILDFARAENATQLVVGASRRGRVSALLRPGVSERVVAEAGDIDIHLVTHDYARHTTSRFGAPDRLSRRRRVVGYLVGILGPPAVTLLMWWTSDWHALPTESMVLMVVVVATALVGGLRPAVIAALGSGLLLNWFFTPPLYTLTIAEPRNVIAIVLFVLVGVAVASVVDNAARRTAQATKARAEADALTALSHSLLNASDDSSGLLASACELFNARGAAILHHDDDGAFTTVTSSGIPPTSLDAADTTVAIDESTTLALAGATPAASQQGLLHAYAAYAKVMGERSAARAANLERLRLTEVDRTRTALLAAVSHDLRSPLSAIKASVDSLCSVDMTWSAQDRDELLAIIKESTDRLIALVNNLLDMSRIHTDSIRAAVAEVPLARAVHNSLVPLEGAHRVQVSIDDQFVVLADPGLLDRALANVCDNALKYTPQEATITIDAAPISSSRVALRIADTGPGVLSSCRTSGSNGVNDVGTSGRSYFGGWSGANGRSTVGLPIPESLATWRCGNTVRDPPPDESPNPPLRSPVQSVWVASFSSVVDLPGLEATDAWPAAGTSDPGGSSG